MVIYNGQQYANWQDARASIASAALAVIEPPEPIDAPSPAMNAAELLDAIRTLMSEREFEKIDGGGERYWSPCNSDGWRKAEAAVAKAERR